MFAQSVSITLANFSCHKPQASWWHHPGMLLILVLRLPPAVPRVPKHFSGGGYLAQLVHVAHSCLSVETHLFLTSCYSSFGLFSPLSLNCDFWWDLQVIPAWGGCWHGDPSEFFHSEHKRRGGGGGRFCATTLFCLSFF